MIEKEMANVQKCLQYGTSLVAERVEQSKLKRPTVSQPTRSRVQNTSIDSNPFPEMQENSKLKKPTSVAKLELGQILQSQVCERSPREQRMTEAAFLTIGSRSRTREKSFGKSRNQTVAQPNGSKSVSTNHTGSRSSSTDQTGCGGQNPSTDHMRRLLQDAKLDLVQILQRSTSAP